MNIRDKMNSQNRIKQDTTNLLGYLDIATKLRNHEFNIQMF